LTRFFHEADIPKKALVPASPVLGYSTGMISAVYHNENRISLKTTSAPDSCEVTQGAKFSLTINPVCKNGSSPD